MNNVCPKGHYSSDPDYCAECGAPMLAVSTPLSQPKQAAKMNGGNANCPDCMTPRHADTRYCEVCRYDFSTASSFHGLNAPAKPEAIAPVKPDLPAAAPAPAAPMAPTTVDDSADKPAAVRPRLLLLIVVDPKLNTDPQADTPCPQDTPEKVFHLDLDENTLGRQYEGKGIHPEIVVNDPGISRRHIKFLRNSTGQFTVLELGSANGTELNRAVLEAGVVTALKPGDQITLGMWTRIMVEAR